MLIYKVTNKINNKKYIGMTTLTLEERKKEHYKKFRQKSRGQALYSALHKYGWDNFTWEVLEEVENRSDLVIMEEMYIEHFQTTIKEFGYNMTLGGDGVINGEFQKYYLIQTPDGDTITVKGWKAFCRDNNLNEGSLSHTLIPYTSRYTKKDGSISIYRKTSNHHKGFKLLGKFNDYPGGEYTQASGNGRSPNPIGL